MGDNDVQKKKLRPNQSARATLLSGE